MSETRDVSRELSVPTREITLTVNDKKRQVTIEDRQLLVQVIRDLLGLKGTHFGCYGGDCGACTVSVNGRITKSCLMLAASADGTEIRTVEGLADGDDLDPVQRAFWNWDAFQCGFCLPGHLFAAHDLIARNPDPSDEEIRKALIGNLCRCTGYQNMIPAIRDATATLRSEGTETSDSLNEQAG